MLGCEGASFLSSIILVGQEKHFYDVIIYLFQRHFPAADISPRSRWFEQIPQAEGLYKFLEILLEKYTQSQY